MKFIALWILVLSSVGLAALGTYNELRKRPHSYYVVYHYGPKDFKDPDQRWGYGWKILDFRKRFDPGSDLKVVLDDFQKKENGRTVIILSWKEIEK